MYIIHLKLMTSIADILKSLVSHNGSLLNVKQRSVCPTAKFSSITKPLFPLNKFKIKNLLHDLKLNLPATNRYLTIICSNKHIMISSLCFFFYTNPLIHFFFWRDCK